MRKIESQMLQAIYARKDWKCDNTQVTVTYFAHGERLIDRTTVYLHGSPIAQITPDTVTVCDYGYQTTTTKSRLNAILRELCGASIYQKNHKWFGIAIEEAPWEIEPNTSHCFVRG
jgi:hypothetical protein